VAQGAAVGQTGAEREIRVEIADSIAVIRSLSLQVSKLALKELAPTSNGTEGIVADDAHGRGLRIHIAPPGADLLCQRLVNAGVEIAGCLGIVDHLCPGHGHKQHCCRKRQDQETSEGTHRTHSFWERSLFVNCFLSH
jgi:hypothetical protein